MLLLDEAAKGFSSIGSEPRLSVLLTLIRILPEGMTIGEIQRKLDIPASTLAHHLRYLDNAKLILQEKHGRETINKANHEKISELSEFLIKECCTVKK